MVKSLISKLFRSASATVQKEHRKTPVKIPSTLTGLSSEQRQKWESLVILGALLSRVAHADENLSKEEEKEILDILSTKGGLKKAEAELVVAAAHKASAERMDVQGFTREVNKRPYSERVHVIELLFQVALADNNLSVVEMEQVRQISRLMWVTHKDFINAKLKIKEKVSK